VFVQQDDCPPGGCEEPFIIYPNPSSDEVFILLNSKEYENLAAITVTDANGVVVYTSRVMESTHIEIPVKGFKNGIYYLSIMGKTGINKQKFVVKH
jgi:hypothetical protein